MFLLSKVDVCKVSGGDVIFIGENLNPTIVSTEGISFKCANTIELLLPIWNELRPHVRPDILDTIIKNHMFSVGGCSEYDMKVFLDNVKNGKFYEIGL